MQKSKLFVLFSLLLIAGCGGGDSNNTVSESQTSTSGSTADYKGLTPEYLVGDWCYTHYQAIDPRTKTLQREEIDRHFIFAADGTYITQQDTDAPMTVKGRYEFLPQGVFKFIIGKTTVVSVTPDEFIVHKTVNHVFHRGACSH